MDSASAIRRLLLSTIADRIEAIGIITPPVSEALSQTGLRVPTGTLHWLDAKTLWHVRKSHPTLSESDLMRIPELILSPDFVGHSRNSAGLKRIWMLKQDDADRLYIAVYGEQKERIMMRGYFTERLGKILRQIKQKGVLLEAVANSAVDPPPFEGGMPW